MSIALTFDQGDMAVAYDNGAGTEHGAYYTIAGGLIGLSWQFGK
jgi:hypothetical protein